MLIKKRLKKCESPQSDRHVHDLNEAEWRNSRRAILPETHSPLLPRAGDRSDSEPPVNTHLIINTVPDGTVWEVTCIRVEYATSVPRVTFTRK